MLTGLRPIFARLLDGILPHACYRCAEPSRGWICPACDVELQMVQDRPACARCAAPLATPGAPCSYCQGGGLRPFRSVSALGAYGPPLDDLVQTAKYAGRWEVARLLAVRWADKHAAILGQVDAVVPVPLHPWRRLLRGYNQSAEIAGVLARLARVPVVHALVRHRNTPTQTQLSFQERIKNMRNAFLLVRPRRIAGRRVLLVDDVTTSGATLREAGRCLLAGRPIELHAAVIAGADPRPHGIRGHTARSP